MQTPTDIIKHFYPFDEDSFVGWALENGHDPEQILEDSKNLGTAVHKLCLEGVEESDDERVKKARQIWNDWCKDNDVKILEVEKKVYYSEDGEVLYYGYIDAIMEIKGKKYIVDLKTWGIWDKDAKELKEAVGEKKTKANLQTALYWLCEEKYKRAVIHLTHNGIRLYEQKRFPRKKIEECLEYCREQNKVTNYLFSN